MEEGDYCIIKERTVIANAITYCNMASQDALREVRGKADGTFPGSPHSQHGQGFRTARQVKDYAVTRCRLHQRAPPEVTPN